MKQALPIRRIWGGILNFFLLGDLLAALFLPLWLNTAEGGIMAGDTVQIVLSCLMLFALTLLLRLAAWGIGRLCDRRVLGSLEAHALCWGDRRIPLAGIRALGYRCFPLARLFGRAPSGLWLQLDDERIELPRAPYWLRIALGFRCPGAMHRPTVGAWVIAGAAVGLGFAVTVWLTVN
ncbi:MAG: hypothetical protein IKD37_04735 [Clostridia bacterium]|nr:hypothetical protein [Clostridia bacterium]